MLVQPLETIERRMLMVLQREHPKATLDQRFEDIGMDSLDYLDFIVKVEDEFNLEVPDDQPFKTPRDLAKFLEGK